MMGRIIPYFLALWQEGKKAVEPAGWQAPQAGVGNAAPEEPIRPGAAPDGAW
jgi:hypothetical protein